MPNAFHATKFNSMASSVLWQFLRVSLQVCNYAYDFAPACRGEKRNPYPSVTAYVQVRSWYVYTGEIAVDVGWFLRRVVWFQAGVTTQLAVWE